MNLFNGLFTSFAQLCSTLFFAGIFAAGLFYFSVKTFWANLELKKELVASQEERNNLMASNQKLIKEKQALADSNYAFSVKEAEYKGQARKDARIIADQNAKVEAFVKEVDTFNKREKQFIKTVATQKEALRQHQEFLQFSHEENSQLREVANEQYILLTNQSREIEERCKSENYLFVNLEQTQAERDRYKGAAIYYTSKEESVKPGKASVIFILLVSMFFGGGLGYYFRSASSFLQRWSIFPTSKNWLSIARSFFF